MAKTVRTDCLAYDKEHKGCKALSCLECAVGDCKFYKNQEQLDRQVARIRMRVPDYEVNPYKQL